MICESCLLAGWYNSRSIISKAEDYHEECKGDCPCQHKIGPGWVKKEGTKVMLMQVQSP
jgi:hypothetical protein